MKNLPGLIDHGISKSTVRTLFQPPNKGHSAASRHKSVVNKQFVEANNAANSLLCLSQMLA